MQKGVQGERFRRRAKGKGTAAVAVHGDSMTRTEVPLARFEGSPFLRVTVTDRAGKRAWLNPVYRD